MSEALRTGELDMAIMLTEGAIAAIAAEESFSIRLPFVMSPLIWGVFAAAGRSDEDLPKLEKAKFAVSRLHSGSHLMAKFYAQRETGVLLGDDQFVVSQNIDGARKVLAEGEADYFLWEKYMTAVWVEKNEFRQIGEVTAPWPAFVFVTRKHEFSDFTPISESLQESLKNFYSGNIMDWIKPLTEQFALSEENARHWLSRIKYYDGNSYWPDRISAAAILMHNNGMLNSVPPLSRLVVT